MEDPFAELLQSLESLFHLEAMRNGKYTCTPIQHLKDATEAYDPKVQNTFIDLLRALRKTIPYLEKRRVDFNSIRCSMDELAIRHAMPSIDWKKILTHPNVSPKFQFSAMNHTEEVELIALVSSKTGVPFKKLNFFEITQALVELENQPGFCQKISAHLKKDPEFLVHLIMASETNFIKIAKTRLSLHLTDSEIASAIIKHSPALVDAQTDPFVQVEQLVHKINDILSNGRSVPLLLRNTEAKTILDNSVFFQIYQSDEYKNRHQPQNQSIKPQ